MYNICVQYNIVKALSARTVFSCKMCNKWTNTQGKWYQEKPIIDVLPCLPELPVPIAGKNKELYLMIQVGNRTPLLLSWR